MGTYLWGPDELEKMRAVGNHGANEVYGAEKVNPTASKEQKQQYVSEKYEKRSFAGKPTSARALKTYSQNARVEKPEPSIPRSDQAGLAGNATRDVAIVAPRNCSNMKGGAAPAVCKVPDSFFDDIFNEAEDGYFGNSLAAGKSHSTHVQIVSQPPLGNDNGLDAFLDSALNVKAPQARSKILDYPASLDPFASTGAQKVCPQDPFSDWPDF